MKQLLATLVMVLAFVGAALADDWAGCFTVGNPEITIYLCTKIIAPGRESPGKLAGAYYNRGVAYDKKSDHDRAIADFDKAIQLKPDSAGPYNKRGAAYEHKGDYDRAIADYDKVIQLKPELAATIAPLVAKLKERLKHPYPKMVATSERITPEQASPPRFFSSADSIDIVKDPVAAAVAPVATKAYHYTTKDPVASLKRATPAVAPAPASQAAVVSLGRRVALVIGNSAYSAVGELANPQRDAEAIASVLKDDGFEVTPADNVTRVEFIAVLNRFSDTAANADWAMIYFAGHGLQLDGLNYLVPIDAKLLADRDVQDEAVPLDRVIAAVDRVRKFGLIIVDACRNNPFPFTVASRAARTRGLAHIQPQGTILVQFAARDGQLALDGDDPTGNSPFAAALAKRLATPGLEVGKLLRLVREDVLAATARQQEPMFSGNIPAEDLFFRLPQ